MTTTAYLDLFLRSISEPALLEIFLRFILLHQHENVHILDTLTSRINTPFRVRRAPEEGTNDSEFKRTFETELCVCVFCFACVCFSSSYLKKFFFDRDELNHVFCHQESFCLESGSSCFLQVIFLILSVLASSSVELAECISEGPRSRENIWT